MIFEILIVAGVGVLCAAIRSFHHPALFRIGTLGFVLTSFLAGWLIGGNIWTGLAFASTWIILPWLEILTKVRRVRLPLERTILPCPPPARSAFPAFSDLSEEMEAGGFEYLEDAGWSHEENRQSYRLFRDQERTTSATICLVEQADFAFYFIALRSQALDGRLFVTWNYPFSYGLYQLPSTMLNRAGGEKSIAEIIGLHRDFLKAGDAPELCLVEEDSLRAEIQADLVSQINHNLTCGILKKEGDSMIRYTVRGMFFLWFQFLRDFVRFS